MSNASLTEARAVESRADTARSWWYCAVSCSRRDSWEVLIWLSWSSDIVSMFMALPPSDDAMVWCGRDDAEGVAGCWVVSSIVALPILPSK